MMFELTMTNVISLGGAFIGALWALLKVITVQGERRISERFDALAKVLSDVAATQDRNAAATLELEREFRKHQADMARDYLRRDDFVRHVGIIETRIDNFALRMERALDNLGGKQ
ncbi:MAG: hypothetical protein JSS18_10320 [Proteobacteria bacterium]|nr:hypothetical protein [Pseudomonadota bacterium]